MERRNWNRSTLELEQNKLAKLLTGMILILDVDECAAPCGIGASSQAD
jgi:hypothetical protein